MRRRLLALLAIAALLPAAAARAQSGTGTADPRVQAAIEALARQVSLPSTAWAGATASHSTTGRQAERRQARSNGLLIGYEHRFTALANPLDQLVIGFGFGPAQATSHARPRAVRTESEGATGTAYLVYSPALFLSFPASVSLGRWSSRQTRAGIPLMPVITSGYRSTSVSTSAAAALTLPLAPFFVTASLGHRYVANFRGGYREAFDPGAFTIEDTRATDTMRTELFGQFRLLYPIGFSSIWVSAGYAHAIARNGRREPRGEVPLGFGVDYQQGPWLVSLAGQARFGREQTRGYGLSGTIRLRF